MPFIGSLDQGTSSTRFMIFNEGGLLVGQDQREHQQFFPKPGWVEHDGLEIWANSLAVIQGALSQAGLSAGELSAIGIANQRETVLAWDISTGLPLSNALVWQDLRGEEFLATLAPELREMVRHRTGLEISPYFSASKIHWLIENNSAVATAIAQGVARFGTIDSWLLWNLSGGVKNGVHLTDLTNASRTLLMDLESLQWDEELLDIFSIPQALLPEIRPSGQLYAYSDATGPLGAAIAISAILGDQQAAMVGQLCFSPGDSKTTYGTGNFALLNTGPEIIRSQHGLLTTLLYQLENQPACYALEGAVAVTGSALTWLRDQIGIIDDISEIETLAASVASGGGVFFVPAFSGLFAPYWRVDARGVIVGLTGATTKAHLCRAALEAICYQTRDIIAAMEADSGITLTSLRVDGGITENKLCMQMQADILGIEIIKPAMSESTAVGAAYMAGLAIGLWPSFAELPLPTSEKSSQRWQATATPEIREEGYRLWKRAVERTFNWVE